MRPDSCIICGLLFSADPLLIEGVGNEIFEGVKELARIVIEADQRS